MYKKYFVYVYGFGLFILTYVVRCLSFDVSSFMDMI